MKHYDKQKYSSLLVKGNLYDAIEYLKKFPEHAEISKEYTEIFENNRESSRSTNKVIYELDLIYQNYYKDVFWGKVNLENAEAKFFKICGSSVEKMIVLRKTHILRLK